MRETVSLFTRCSSPDSCIFFSSCAVVSTFGIPFRGTVRGVSGTGELTADDTFRGRPTRPVFRVADDTVDNWDATVATGGISATGELTEPLPDVRSNLILRIVRIGGVSAAAVALGVTAGDFIDIFAGQAPLDFMEPFGTVRCPKELSLPDSFNSPAPAAAVTVLALPLVADRDETNAGIEADGCRLLTAGAGLDCLELAGDGRALTARWGNDSTAGDATRQLIPFSDRAFGSRIPLENGAVCRDAGLTAGVVTATGIPAVDDDDDAGTLANLSRHFRTSSLARRASSRSFVLRRMSLIYLPSLVCYTEITHGIILDQLMSNNSIYSISHLCTFLLPFYVNYDHNGMRKKGEVAENGDE